MDTGELRVRVHDLTPLGNAGERLSMVSELCPASQALPDGHAPFLPDSIAPHGEWRIPKPDELSGLLGVPGDQGESDLFVISLPQLSGVLSRHLVCRDDLSSVQKAVRDVAFLQALETCVEDLIPFCIRPDNLLCQGAWVNAGRMRLVTHNMVLVPPRRIGLHVDNWDRLPLAERAYGRRRLCVNIGLRPRYLIFLQRSLSTLVAAGKVPKEIPNEMSPAMLVRTYLGRNLEQPAVRVRIDPGEAYIVNADDVIHDGASDEHDAPDIAIHFLGHFGPT